MNKNLSLFLTFAKMGAITFGGGYAMLPILQHELVEKRRWTTDEKIIDYYAIGQCVPGVIAVNTATFIGREQNGPLGGVCATLGVVFPSFAILTLIAAFLGNFADIPAVQNAFAGIRVCVCVLIINAVLKLLSKSVIDVPTGVIFGAVFLLGILFDVSPVIFIVAAGVAGVVIKALGGLRP